MENNHREINCYHCGNFWKYKGNQANKTTCTNCGCTVYFRKSRKYREFGTDFFTELHEKFIELGCKIHNDPDKEQLYRQEFAKFRSDLIWNFERGIKSE